MAQNATLIMLSRPKRSCPAVSATRQERRRQTAMPTSGSHRRKPAKKMMPTSTIEPNKVATTSWRMLREISDTKAGRPVTRICNPECDSGSHPSAALARNSFTRRIKRWHSKALTVAWFVTTRKMRMVRSGEVRGCSCSMMVLSAKGFSAGAIRPSGSNESSNSGRGEPASISWRRR